MREHSLAWGLALDHSLHTCDFLLATVLRATGQARAQDSERTQNQGPFCLGCSWPSEARAVWIGTKVPLT